MPLVRLGPHECNPFSEPHAGMAGATPDVPCGHAVSRINGDLTCATTRLVRNNATAIPPCKFCNLLKQRRICGVFPRFSLNFCSKKTGHIQLLGGWWSEYSRDPAFTPSSPMPPKCSAMPEVATTQKILKGLRRHSPALQEVVIETTYSSA
jgi:hypothetical protein